MEAKIVKLEKVVGRGYLHKGKVVINNRTIEFNVNATGPVYLDDKEKGTLGFPNKEDSRLELTEGYPFREETLTFPRNSIKSDEQEALLGEFRRQYELPLEEPVTEQSE